MRRRDERDSGSSPSPLPGRPGVDPSLLARADGPVAIPGAPPARTAPLTLAERRAEREAREEAIRRRYQRAARRRRFIGGTSRPKGVLEGIGMVFWGIGVVVWMGGALISGPHWLRGAIVTLFAVVVVFDRYRRRAERRQRRRPITAADLARASVGEPKVAPPPRWPER